MGAQRAVRPKSSTGCRLHDQDLHVQRPHTGGAGMNLLLG